MTPDYYSENHRRLARMISNIIIAAGIGAAIMAMFTGCVQTRITTVDGTHFETVRFFWSGGIKDMTFKTAHGEATVTGYHSDGDKSLEAISSGITQGAIKAVMPKP